MQKTLITLVVLSLAATAAAAPSAGRKCQIAKTQQAGEYAACLAKAEAKLLNAEGTCSLTSATACHAGSACPDGLAAATMQGVVDAHVANVAAGLAGDGFISCGAGDIDAGEDCDVGDLQGGTCAGEGFAGGELACSPRCTYETTGCYAQRFVDNGDGTISDLQTNLTWEKKSDDGGIHDKDDTSYTWGVPSGQTPPDGTAFTVFLAALNGADDGVCLAGHCDWRLPKVDELQTILQVPCTSNPCVLSPFHTGCAASCDTASCSCTRSGYDATATTDAADPARAVAVHFANGLAVSWFKDLTVAVRAERSGS